MILYLPKGVEHNDGHNEMFMVTPSGKSDELLGMWTQSSVEGLGRVAALGGALQYANTASEAASALGELRATEAVSSLLELTRGTQRPEIRKQAIRALGQIGDRSAQGALVELLDDGGLDQAAAKALGQLFPNATVGADPQAWKQWAAKKNQ